ncbi:hypothetical protein [Vagococcus humatus]|uniref:SnoaL-like domain-containing protein n=1 Tax=Vagococcus humatus TaxID=1889241 RepID=A0A3R9YDP3_9ENTE|nr:hypothetical protein [Vagococcus humatus]RST88854.1 hypothetical protein C7P63_08515 [Vagococcus humatus]
MRRKISLLLALLLLLFMGAGYLKEATDIAEASNKQVSPTGNITDKKEAQKTLQLLVENLDAASQKDVNRYVDTLVTSAQTSTAKEMTVFFKTYTLEHRLLSFQVVKQETDHMLVKTKQQTLNRGTSQYKDHITHANHTFVKENNKWKIEETIMTQTEFINP